MLKKIIKIYGALVTTFTIIVLLLGSVLVLPRIFGVNCYAVKSGSMEPALHVGALVYVNTNNTFPEAGEIAVYKVLSDDNETMVMHRVITKTEEGYQFRGDANKNTDALIVRQEQIVGTYILQIPKAGFFLAHLKRRNIFILIVLIVLLNCSVIPAERFIIRQKG